MKRSLGVAAALVAGTLAVGSGATTIAASRSAVAPAQDATAGACTVGVSWNNFQQPRWAAHDQPNLKATVEAGGGVSLADLESRVTSGQIDPHPVSGRQEALENAVNQRVWSVTSRT